MVLQSSSEIFDISSYYGQLIVESFLQQSLIPCGAYSVTQGSISSISPHRTDRAFSECPRLGERGESSRTQRNCLNNTAGPPDLSGVSYYRYH